MPPDTKQCWLGVYSDLSLGACPTPAGRVLHEPRVEMDQGMELIVVERRFEDPTPVAEIQALEDAVASCLEDHRVRFLKTYCSKDQRQMVCLYHAPDAEAVRATQRQGKLPFDWIWKARVFEGKPRDRDLSNYEIVLAQRQFPEKVGVSALLEMYQLASGCMSLHRAFLKETWLSADGMRAICRYRAPDAESVRVANQQSGLPLERAWTSTVHEPQT